MTEGISAGSSGGYIFAACLISRSESVHLDVRGYE